MSSDVPITLPDSTGAFAPERSERIDWIRRAIAILEVVGGLHGLLFAIPITFSPGFVIGLPFLLIYLASIVAGIGLWRGTRRGERWSRIVQFVQLPWLASTRVSYLLSCGPGLWAGFGAAGPISRRVVGSSFLIELHFNQ